MGGFGEASGKEGKFIIKASTLLESVCVSASRTSTSLSIFLFFSSSSAKSCCCSFLLRTPLLCGAAGLTGLTLWGKGGGGGESEDGNGRGRGGGRGWRDEQGREWIGLERGKGEGEIGEEVGGGG